MKKQRTNKILVIISIVAMVGFAATAFAGWGMGYGHRGWGMDETGPGYCGQGSTADLSEEDLQKVDEARKAFFEETEGLRQNVYQKELELRSEFAKENPDADKISGLQKEISELEGQLDQKRVTHMLKMKKINPNAGTRGWGSAGKGYAQRGYGRGPGSRGGCR
ncbi:MAG: periplasmic heavy metal sensor [Deltaproteobacteria bacterium]|nr:periplasmic heavy metal sensor [Deltaproteobacteria bacterium]